MECFFSCYNVRNSLWNGTLEWRRTLQLLSFMFLHNNLRIVASHTRGAEHEHFTLNCVIIVNIRIAPFIKGLNFGIC